MDEITKKINTIRKSISGRLQNGIFTESDKCPLCKDTGMVIVTKDDGYEYAEECKCGIRQREVMKSRLSFANIPEAFKDVRLENFSQSIYRNEDSRIIIAKDCKAVRWWLDDLEQMKDEGTGLYLYSAAKGSGKTRMAVSIANELIYEHGMNVKFATSVQILNEIKASWKEEEGVSEHQLLKDLSRAEVLIVDDFGIETVKDWIMEKLYQIINTRYINKMITIFTSNLSIDELKYDDRITNRIKEKCFPLAFPDESIRNYIAEDNMARLKAVMAS